MEVAKRCPRFPPFPDRHHDALAMLVLHLLGTPLRRAVTPLEPHTPLRRAGSPAMLPPAIEGVELELAEGGSIQEVLREGMDPLVEAAQRGMPVAAPSPTARLTLTLTLTPNPNPNPRSPPSSSTRSGQRARRTATSSSAGASESS